jgi:hypothetical protein
MEGFPGIHKPNYRSLLVRDPRSWLVFFHTPEYWGFSHCRVVCSLVGWCGGGRNWKLWVIYQENLYDPYHIYVRWMGQQPRFPYRLPDTSFYPPSILPSSATGNPVLFPRCLQSDSRGRWAWARLGKKKHGWVWYHVIRKQCLSYGRISEFERTGLKNGDWLLPSVAPFFYSFLFHFSFNGSADTIIAMPDDRAVWAMRKLNFLARAATWMRCVR